LKRRYLLEVIKVVVKIDGLVLDRLLRGMMRVRLERMD